MNRADRRREEGENRKRLKLAYAVARREPDQCKRGHKAHAYKWLLDGKPPTACSKCGEVLERRLL